MLPFDDNPSSKIGVRFDKPILDGVDLGGLCELGHGFFCNGNVTDVLLICMCSGPYEFCFVLRISYHLPLFSLSS